jgi:hypothetical protein
LEVNVDRFGKSIFGHCFTKIQNDFPFTLVSHGKAWVGVRIIVSDVRIERRSPDQGRIFFKEIFRR